MGDHLMLIYVLIVGAVLFFAGGTILILHGWDESKGKNKAVPISDLTELKTLKKKGDDLDSNPVEKEKMNLAKALEREVASKDKASLLEREQKQFEAQKEELKKAWQNNNTLTDENHQLKNQLEVERKKGDDFYSSVLLAKKTFCEEISVLKKTITQLKKESVPPQEKETQVTNKFIQDEVKKSSECISTLQDKCSNLLNEKTERDMNFSRIKEFNEHLVEKEKSLQHELTKNRAQALGLEKICKDFKDQIENMNKTLSENGLLS